MIAAAALGPPYPVDDLANDARILLAGADVDRGTGDHYLLTYRSTATDNVYYRLFGYTGALLRTATVFAAGAGETTVPGTVAFDEGSGTFLIAYGVDTGFGQTRVARYEHSSTFPVAHLGTGCGTGDIDWVGSQLIGSGGTGITMGNVPAGALMVAIASTVPASLQLFGVPPFADGCSVLVQPDGPGYLGMFPPAIGPNTFWALPLPEALPSLTVHFQGVHFDVTSSVLYTTDRLTVPLVK